VQTRRLGRSGIEVSPIGIGCWAIGGPSGYGENPVGWGEVDDAESTRAIQRAVELGATLFDTADVYGTGHSERVLGAALKPFRDQVRIATKWGLTYDEASRQILDSDVTPGYVRRALTASLRRLQTDYIDVYQLHEGEVPPDQAAELVGACEELVAEGLIRTYGWSTDDVASAEIFAKGPHCGVVQHELNVFNDPVDMLALCEAQDLASLNRSPLAMGLLSDRVTAQSRFGPDDIRGHGASWLQWFKDGRPAPEFLRRRDAIRDILTSGGRTVAQGALAWIWARSDRTIPLVGCRTVAQVEENVGAVRFGPLTPEQMDEVRSVGTTPR
jgi:aryl-alcohol dehydrogenase-like predicted oxidoreductase